MSRENVIYAEQVLQKFFETLQTQFDESYKAFLERNRKIICDEYQFYLEWISRYSKHEDANKYSTTMWSFVFAPVRRKDSKYCETVEYDPYKGNQYVWNFRYDQRLIRTLSVVNSEMRKRIIATCFLLGQGYFKRVVLNELGPMYFTGSFYFEITARHFLVFLILPERIPRKFCEKIEGYTYSQYIRFLDIVDSQEKVEDLVKKYFKEISRKFDKYEFFMDENNCKALPFFRNPTIYMEDSLNCNSIATHVTNSQNDTWYEPLFFENYVELPVPIYIYYHQEIKKSHNQTTYNYALEEALKVILISNKIERKKEKAITRNSY